MKDTLPPLAAMLVAGLYLAWVGPLLPWVLRSALDDGGLWKVALIGASVWLSLPHLRPSRRPTARLSPVALALAVIPPIFVPFVSSIETAVVLLAVISGYGLLGLWLGREQWRALRPLALLVALVVPASVWIDVALGWPLRKGIASLAAGLLGGVPVETVIRVEGGIAHIDTPCAGVGSLWMLAAMLLVWAMARGRSIDGRWLLIAGLSSVVAIGANTSRVVVLVALAHLWRLPLLADTVHVPLGVIGFVSSLVFGIAIGERFGNKTPEVSPAREIARVSPWRWYLTSAALLVSFAVAPSPPIVQTWPVPVPVGWSEMAPSDVERTFAREHGAAVTKARGPDGASVVMVASDSWLAHHVPEQCLVAAGWRVTEDEPAWIDGVPVRIARLRREGQSATALWWFQSGEQMTDDLVARIRTGGRWVLVSVLLPGEPTADELDGFLEPMRRAASGGET